MDSDASHFSILFSHPLALFVARSFHGDRREREHAALPRHRRLRHRGRHHGQVSQAPPIKIELSDFSAECPRVHGTQECTRVTALFSLSLGQPVKGTSRVKAEIRLPPGDREPDVEYAWPVVEHETRYVSTVTVDNCVVVILGHRQQTGSDELPL